MGFLSVPFSFPFEIEDGKLKLWIPGWLPRAEGGRVLRVSFAWL
jgi:hypothetical protein